MQAKAVPVAILFVTGILTAALGEAIVTLKSGEVLQGDIVSDTNDVLQIRAFSVNRTISSLRNVPHADIQNIYNETPAEAAERIDCFALSKFQLNPDQEHSTDFYTQWIAAFEKFLTDYPKSDKTQIIKQHIEACQAELKHVIAGEAKFENKWMTPVEKRPLSLNKQLADLEQQRASLAKTVDALQGKLEGLQARLRTLPKNITREVAHDEQRMTSITMDINGTPPRPFQIQNLRGRRMRYIIVSSKLLQADRRWLTLMQKSKVLRLRFRKHDRSMRSHLPRWPKPKGLPTKPSRNTD